MRTRTVVSVAALFFAAVAVATQFSSFVPLIMWSGRSYFADQAAASRAVSQSELRHMLSQILSPQLLPDAGGSKYLNTPVYYTSAHAPPEVVLAFVYSELSSAAASRAAGAYDASPSAVAAHGHGSGALAFAHSAVQSAASSLSAPFYQPVSAVSDSIVALHNSLAPNAQVFATVIEDDAVSSSSGSACATLLAHMDDHPNIYRDGQSDLILVKLQSYNAHDSCVRTVSEHVSGRTAGSFVAVLSADSAFASPVQAMFAESSVNAGIQLNAVNSGARPSRPFKTQATATSNYTNVYPGILFLTSSVLWGLILALIFVIAISCGVCWVQSIETPARFTTQALQLAKEY